MFKFARDVEASVKFRAANIEATVKVRFKWLSESAKAEILRIHDVAIQQLQPSDSKEKPADPLSIQRIHADVLMGIADGWDLAYEDGGRVPWDREEVASVLDHVPGLFFVLLDGHREATSAQAIRGN